jgi:hypothetical protein
MSARMRKLRLKVEVKREGCQGIQEASGENISRRGRRLFLLLANPGKSGPDWPSLERRQMRQEVAAALEHKSQLDWHSPEADARPASRPGPKRPLSPEAKWRRMQKALGLDQPTPFSTPTPPTNT